MHVKRLELLAAKLESIPKHKFNLETWMAASNSGTIRFNLKALETWDGKGAFQTIRRDVSRAGDPYNATRNIVKPRECQTVGCAMGWATTMPEFRKLGLRLMAEHRDDRAVACIVKKGVITASHFNAAKEIFDFPHRIAEVLFDPSEYEHDQRDDPKYVIARIKDLIQGKEVKGCYITVKYEDGTPMVYDDIAKEWNKLFI